MLAVCHVGLTQLLPHLPKLGGDKLARDVGGVRITISITSIDLAVLLHEQPCHAVVVIHFKGSTTQNVRWINLGRRVVYNNVEKYENIMTIDEFCQIEF